MDKFLTVDNAAALLIFADSYSCALLKEAATHIFVTGTSLDYFNCMVENQKVLPASYGIGRRSDVLQEGTSLEPNGTVLSWEIEVHFFCIDYDKDADD